MDGPSGARRPTPAQSAPDLIADPIPGRTHGLSGGLRAAFMVLSRVPVGRGDLSLAARRWASGWFPLVGAALAAIAGAAADVLAPGLGGFLAAAIAVGVLALLTGALHEDGLADSADALGGARDRAQIFVILKDSRHGTYGVLTLVLMVLLRVGALDRLLAQQVSAALFAFCLAGMLSRLSLTWLLFSLPYVTPTGTSRSADVAHAGGAQVVLASVLAIVGLGALGATAALPWVGIAGALAATTVSAAVAGLIFLRRAGGITGDFLGATAQITETACLIALVALPPV
ncbi:MAG TPA: adenosylcobinamide-GDP ribazoletransferase [Polyangia bacterium]